MSAPLIYDADQVVLSVFGARIGGYADGEFLRVEPEGPDFGDVVGTDGQVTRFKTGDRRATATVLLLQSSASNDVLSAVSNLDRDSPNGAGVGEFLVEDLSGRTLLRGQCWISQPPTVSFGREAGPREWTLRISRLERFDGGN